MLARGVHDLKQVFTHLIIDVDLPHGFLAGDDLGRRRH